MLGDKLTLFGLQQLKPETANSCALKALELRARLPGMNHAPIKAQPRELMGLKFENPLGIAAGLDKDGVCINGLVSLGPGFIELGGVTPRAQSGNSGVRIMRLVEQEGLINRLGLNNLGSAQLAKRLAKFRQNYQERYKKPSTTIIGVNLGKNAATPLKEAAHDYKQGLSEVHRVADYATLNISSPNTPNLRQLQGQDYLAPLLAEILEAEAALARQHSKKCPLLLKISPDLPEREIRQVVHTVNQAGLAGVIATNTTIEHPWREQLAGGLSGRPLAARALEVLQLVKSELATGLCLISCGGIDSPEEMARRFTAGADLVSLYTALVYKGGGIIRTLLEEAEQQS